MTVTPCSSYVLHYNLQPRRARRQALCLKFYGRIRIRAERAIQYPTVARTALEGRLCQARMYQYNIHYKQGCIS